MSLPHSPFRPRFRDEPSTFLLWRKEDRVSRDSSARSKVHSFKSSTRSRPPPLPPSPRLTFLLFFLPPRRPGRPSTLRSHDVTRAGITHAPGNRCESANVSGPARRREGRDSFEPRLVFASPCVPRTSYFNETICLCFSFSLLFPLLPPVSPSSSFFSSRRLARESTDRSSRAISSRTVSLSLSLFLPSSLSPSALPRCLRTYRKKRKALKARRISAWSMKNTITSIRTYFRQIRALCLRGWRKQPAIIANRRTAMNNAIIFDFVIASYSCISIKI